VRRVFLASFLILSMLALVSCGGGGYGGYSQPTPPTAGVNPTASQPSGASEVRVSIKDFAFVPVEVTVSKGTKVTWTNEDAAPHTVTGSSFDSGALNKGQSWSIAFDSQGTFEYRCDFHPSMKGKVIVQ